MTNSLREMRQCLNALSINIQTMIVAKEKPVAAPCDVTVEQAMARDLNRHVFAIPIARDIADAGSVAIRM